MYNIEKGIIYIDRLIEKRFKFIVGTKSTKLIKERVEKVKDIKKFTNYLVRLRTDIENNVENESRQELYKKYTTQELLDELDIIESYEREGEKLRLGEITKNRGKYLKNWR